MGQIFVYAPEADDFTTIGLCGALTPTQATFEEKKNDLSELTLTHPLDENSRWSYLLDGYVLQADVPVRTVPEILSGAIVTSIEEWHIKAGATKAERTVYNAATGGKALTVLPLTDGTIDATKVYVVDKGDTRYKIKWRSG